MNSRDQRAEEILAAAMEIADPAARKNHLDHACGDDSTLRQEVESLLASHAQAGEFLRTKRPVGSQPAVPSEKTGDRIGRYKLLEQIGEGGFGVVWMAEQEEPVRRRVALKIIKLGMDTREVIARFEAERQALALMEHPHIASVFDGGATDTGRPYFVMELVKGLPITEYCDANKLSTTQRLELFAQVCLAVQHAHQKGVIHRDLKPSNILVTVKDDKPVPKVIDFGVAKATQARLTERTYFTQFRQWIGTPAYMSPEQAGLASLDVDTRSDVYSLGVLLYELLTGRTPFDTQKLLEKGYEAVMRTIREDEPPKPSTRLSTLNDEELGAVAVKRGAAPAKLGRLVHGDLDWIVMKALEKDRTRRYETAVALAQDVGRHLRAEPVSAGEPDFVYRAGKFIRRNRTRLAFASLGVVALSLAIVGGKLALNFQSARRAFQATGTNTVFSAARSDDVVAMRRLLDANPGFVMLCDAGGSTPLAYAAEAGSTNTLQLLIARGALVDDTNYSGWTPLIQAASKGRAAVVELLLAAGANPNHAANQGERALNMASLTGSIEVGKLLIAKGAQVDAAVLPSKTTALQQSAMMGRADFAELLLAHGARTDFKDANGFTPLHAAASGLSMDEVFGNWHRRLRELTTHTTGDPGIAPAAAAVSNRLAQYWAELPAELLEGGGEHRRVAELLLMSKANMEATNNLGATPLWTAAASTNGAVAELLIKHKARLNTRSQNGFTPLHAAAGRDCLPIVTLLLNAGADSSIPDKSGFTPLHSAVEHGYAQVAEALLTHGADPNLACPTGQTPLHTAAGRGDVEAMRRLLDRGATLHPLTRAGTPLAWAVDGGKDAIEFLLQRGAKPDIASPANGMTPLHWAAVWGRPECVRALLAGGAPVNAVSSWIGSPLNAAVAGRRAAEERLIGTDSLTPPGFKHVNRKPGTDADYLETLTILLANKADIEARELGYDRTPIFMAASQGNLPAVEKLLAAGAQVTATDKTGCTALHAVSESSAPTSVLSNIVARLLKAGASPDARDRLRASPLHAAANAGKPEIAAMLLKAGAGLNSPGPNLCTPLQVAVLRSQRAIVELLLNKGADPDWRDKVGSSALHQAAYLREKELVALLIAHDASMDLVNDEGSTPLLISSAVGDPEIIKLLLEHGAKINAANRNGWTPFMAAAESGRVEVAQLLLERGAEFNVTGKNGATPLISAARLGRVEMVKFLAAKGASFTAADEQGFTALHEAADRGHAEMVEFLLAQGLEVDVRSNNRSTPLSCAANAAFAGEDQYVAVVKILLARGADVNAPCRSNMTPVHHAAAKGRALVLQTFLATKPDLTARDASGKTALDLAVAGGHKPCAALLRKALAPPKPDTHPKER